MFNLNSLRDNEGFQRNEIVGEWLERHRFGPIHNVWASPGHVFFTGNGGRSLVSLDQLSINQEQPESGILQITALSSPIKELLFLKSQPSTVIAVQEDGNTQFWDYCADVRQWSCSRQIRLCKTVGAVITSVLLHDTHAAVYWCEKVPDSNSTSVHCVNLPRGESSFGDIDSTTALVLGAPEMTLLPLADELLMLPREPCPPGVYLTWSPSLYTIHACIYPQGTVLTEKKYSHPIDFQQLARQLFVQWAKAERISSWIPVNNTANQKLWIINRSGDLLEVTDHGADITKVVTMDGGEEFWKSSTQCLLMECVVVAMTGEKLRVLSMESGRCLQEFLPDPSAAYKHLWWTKCNVFSIGVHTADDILQLQICSSRQVLVSSCDEAPQILQKLQQMRHSTQLHLEQTYNIVKAGGKGDTCTQLDPEKFQSPAVILALLEQGKVNLGVSVGLLSDLKVKARSHKGCRKSPTNLTKILDLYVQQYWELENQNFEKVKMRKNSPLEREISGLLNSASSLDLSFRCSQLEILYQRHPIQTSITLVSILGLHNTGREDAEEDTICHWKNLMTASSNESQRNQMLLTICRILFKSQPHLLVTALEMAASATGSSEGNTFQASSDMSELCRDVLRNLPSLQFSSVPKTAALATAQLIVRSGTPKCEMRSVDILVAETMYDEAVTIVSEASASGANEYSMLYRYLIMALKQAGVLHQYYQQVLAIAPPDEHMSDLLYHLDTKSEHKATLSAEDGRLRIKDIRDQLLLKLSST